MRGRAEKQTVANMSTLAKYPRATTITIYSLGAFLGLIHVFLGFQALSPMISADYHREMKINFNNYAKSLTFIHSFIDRATLAYYMRLIVANLQMALGAMLVENNHFGVFGKIGNLGLIVLNFFLFFNQLNVGISYERIAPTIVFTVLLAARLLIIEQSTKKTKVGVKTRNAGKKTSTPKKNKNE